MDLGEREMGWGGELGRVEGGETVAGMYFMREEYIANINLKSC